MNPKTISLKSKNTFYHNLATFFPCMAIIFVKLVIVVILEGFYFLIMNLLNILLNQFFYPFCMSVTFEDSIKVFLQKSIRLNLILYAENVEEFLLNKYLAEGYTKEQILDMKLKEVWPIIKDIKSKKERY